MMKAREPFGLELISMLSPDWATSLVVRITSSASNCIMRSKDLIKSGDLKVTGDAMEAARLINLFDRYQARGLINKRAVVGRSPYGEKIITGQFRLCNNIDPPACLLTDRCRFDFLQSRP
jgi:hypothetical protein